MVDRKLLRRLLVHKHKNRQRIREMLYALANVVATRYDRRNAEDLRSGIYLKLDKSIDKYRRERGDAFSYFFQIGYHEAILLSGGQKYETINGIDDETTRALADIDPVITRKRQVPASAVDAIDKMIARTRVEVRRIAKLPHARWGTNWNEEQVQSKEYEYLVAGMTFLQELRKQLVGTYQRVKLPTHSWRGELFTKHDRQSATSL